MASIGRRAAGVPPDVRPDGEDEEECGRTGQRSQVNPHGVGSGGDPPGLEPLFQLELVGVLPRAAQDAGGAAVGAVHLVAGAFVPRQGDVGVADGAVEVAGGHGSGIGGSAGALEGRPRRARWYPAARDLREERT